MVRSRRPGVRGMVTAPRPIPDAVRATQARASDPASSAFVSANAGSGKTHVLVQRVIRLLLAGVAPEKILCITFTKAAAANMAERVFSTLGHWVTLDDSDLDARIADAAIVGAAAAQMAAALGVDPGDTIEDVEREIVDGPYLRRSGWQDIAATLDTGSKSDSDQAVRLRAALASTGSTQVDEYLGVFL